uniref:CCHC-type domain-containing protein n=1 Tax=Rhodnius prolixus TaxID=13249 RepID=T1HNT4_RHOPR
MSGVCKGPDRSKLCYKCGEQGHLAVTCTAEGCCMLCRDREIALDACRHLPGAGGCVVFREALEQGADDYQSNHALLDLQLAFLDND